MSLPYCPREVLMLRREQSWAPSLILPRSFPTLHATVGEPFASVLEEYSPKERVFGDPHDKQQPLVNVEVEAKG